jgi:DNA-binding transcriptional LysR family regulator
LKFDIRSVIQFAAVAEELSFRRAAERLRVAQPWLSTRIRQLEEQLGFALFVRTTRKMELTEAGRIFLWDASAVAAAAEAAEHSASSLRAGQSGRIRIGVPPYHATLPQKTALVRRFTEKRPTAAVELEVGWSPNLLHRLIDRTIDVAFVVDFVGDEALESLTLGEYESVIALRSNDEMAKSESIRLADLRGCQVAVFTRGLNPHLYDRLYAPLKAAGAKLRQVPEFADLDVHRPMNADFRMFTTLAPKDCALVASPTLVIRRLADYAVQIPLQLARRRGWSGKLADEFWHLARAVGAVVAQNSTPNVTPNERGSSP